MFTACELGIFDVLHDIGEPLSAAAIASRLCTTVDGTERLLDACVGLKLLKVQMVNNDAMYSNTEVSSVYLVKSSPKTLFHMMMHHSQTFYKCWHFLPQAIREGSSQYERALGIPSKDTFEVLYRSDEEMMTLVYHMDAIWNISGKDVIQAFDLSEFHTVFDIGGCSGAIAKQFVSAYPGSMVTVMDLPKVIEIAKKYFMTENDHQISFLGGDFFNDTIPEADLYILCRVIHDWSEDKCLQLLKKIYHSCRPGGAVLIIEFHLNEDRSGPLTSQLRSLTMLVMTEGKERTPSEYRKLLADSGFRDFEFRVTGKMYGAFLGRK
ncbi:acetylserotonin O-methyltransferase-like isoform X2 [Hyperolius riggenbachi]